MLSKKLFISAVSIIVCAGLVAGCAAKESSLNVATGIEKKAATIQEDSQVKVMAEFKTLLESSPKADTVIAWIDKNISSVSKKNASMLVTSLDEIQKQGLPKLEAKYNNSDTFQSKLSKLYKPGLDLNKLEYIQDDKELKDLLNETKDMGYKVEIAEGMFFPVMNYEFYKKYSTYVTSDIKDYINIMAVESNKMPAKDAALMIGWNEIIQRALVQEKFIRNYASSPKAGEVRDLLKKYLMFMLYGTNNTPLFSYDTKQMKPEAKAAYLNALKINGDSALMQTLGKYMDLLNKTNDKLTDAVEKFRKEAMESAVF